MLKLCGAWWQFCWDVQPPSGGCVLKQKLDVGFDVNLYQPPSGGCVLKLKRIAVAFCDGYPAAFGRLCVETFSWSPICEAAQPAAFGRLCVETP